MGRNVGLNFTCLPCFRHSGVCEIALVKVLTEVNKIADAQKHTVITAQSEGVQNGK